MKPSLPQGTRDFGPDEVRKRNYIFDTIRTVFEIYGFQPLETPAFENLETLTGKYGDEGDKLMFKILNNGLSDERNTEKAKTAFENILAGKTDKNLTERALKYDLTIPFARYVAMNHTKLTLPFKRYQLQPVWRADRPQKGRYREFYQCDADVVGSNSLLNEIEFVNMYGDVFQKLKLNDATIHINHRKILRGIMEVCRVEEKEKQILVIIDKMDKIGIDDVRIELLKAGMEEERMDKLLMIFNVSGTATEKLAYLEKFLAGSKSGLQGVSDVRYVLDNGIKSTSSENFLQLDLTLARGLEYYTGIIFEAKAPETVKIGSIGGGGRYDDLTGLFDVPGIPGVGISFGVDRIYDVLEELGLFPEEVHLGTQVLFFNLGDDESRQALKLIRQLRDSGIRCELFHEVAKFDKQFRYAEKKNIPFIIIIGSKETESGTFVMKDLRSGVQQTLPQDNLGNISFI